MARTPSGIVLPSAVCLLPFSSFLAPPDRLLDRAAFGVVSRDLERGGEVIPCGRAISSAKFELAKRRTIERVLTKAIAIRQLVQLRYPTFGTITLRDRDRTIEGHDRRRRN